MRLNKKFAPAVVALASLAGVGVAGVSLTSEASAARIPMCTTTMTQGRTLVPASASRSSYCQMGSSDGSFNPAVKLLQHAINQCTQAPGTLVEDGLYGGRTVEAVKWVQKRYGAAVDGWAGPETLSKMPWPMRDRTEPNMCA